MANEIQLALAIHNHQPVGNFSGVIQEACDTAYLPFLRALSEFPTIRLGLHTSGCLWEWVESNCSRYGELVAEMVSRGQLELLGGGMYEPILPVLPERDAVWQINRMSNYLQQRFGTRPEGMWCPERVWEPQMPRLMANCGIRYTLLDDHHFRSSALPAQVKTDYFITEHEGKAVSLMPICQKLRYTIPFQAVDESIEYLRELMESCDEPPLVVFGDDGEKFGVWPDTYDWVYEKGWLKKFFTALEENSDWIRLLLPREVLKVRRPAAKVFIPCSSYMEMGKWSRVDPDADADSPPGFWRNYLSKYPESNQLYRRMLHVSAQLNTARELGISDNRLDSIADDLGRGQCNCAYWHGIFGGLYLNYLRQALYRQFLRAESGLRYLVPPLYQSQVVVFDHDGLGWEQALLQNDTIAAVLDPGRGLCLTRLDYRPTSFCWTDVLARRREAYHEQVHKAKLKADADEHESIHERILAKESGLEHLLVVDPHQRVSFTTFFGTIHDPGMLMIVPMKEDQGHKRVSEDYGLACSNWFTFDKGVGSQVRLGSFTLSKTATLLEHGLKMELKAADGVLPVESGEFCVEFNLTVLTDRDPGRYLLAGDEQLSLEEPTAKGGLSQIDLVDGWQHRKLSLSSDHEFRLVTYPVHTVSNSEGGFERTYQGTCLILCFHPLVLMEGITLELVIEELPDHEA